ncbi:MAG: serine/threonine protein phosphatase [Actinophytocola sp.]|uniref:protein phosphatase 2C domain-containing protein n=1 Tax=Actinophytocola sp. TaxID=1872138 RepID=UPI001323D65F|nr:protein phosphatase 2C domain-containing protein [Actinophytocola sp.]MPZ83240.1 serine/threonine protein phosphatase [Actinophytocola sp.]
MTCPNCGEAVGAKDRFCEGCGTSLLVTRTPAGGPLGAAGGGAGAGACVACGGADVGADGFCEDCGRAQPAGRDRMECDLGLVAGISDKGARRARNEDSMAFGVVAGETPTVVAVVCDGVATSDRADNASQAAVDEATDVLLDAVLDGKDADGATRAAVARAVEVVATLADPTVPGTAPSCTYVSAVVTPTEVTVGWVGDSRIYWLASAGPSRALTIDDTVATELVAEGMSEEEAMSVHQAHALSKWIGADAGDVEPRTLTVAPDGPGLVLLCSDGLWNYLPEAQALVDALPGDDGAALTEVDLLAAASELTRVALALGGHDNITTVLVPFPPNPDSPRSES